MIKKHIMVLTLNSFSISSSSNFELGKSVQKLTEQFRAVAKHLVIGIQFITNSSAEKALLDE